jgi:hypothetical protein
MHLLPLVALLVLAAATGGYAHLFRKRKAQRLQRLREADGRVGRDEKRAARRPRRTRHPATPAAIPRLQTHPFPGASRARKAPPPPIRHTHPARLPGWMNHVIAKIVLVLFFTVMLLIGVVVPGASALRLFHSADLLTQYPLTPESLLLTARYAFYAAVVLVTLGMLGLGRYGLFLTYFLMGLFACSFIAALLFSSIVILPVDLVLSSLWGIDAMTHWRPFVHLAFAAVGVVWAWSICYDARRDLLYDGPPIHGNGGYSFRGSPGTAAVAGGSLFSDLFGGDSGGAGGSWSSDSDGGDGGGE